MSPDRRQAHHGPSPPPARQPPPNRSLLVTRNRGRELSRLAGGTRNARQPPPVSFPEMPPEQRLRLCPQPCHETRPSPVGARDLSPFRNLAGPTMPGKTGSHLSGNRDWFADSPYTGGNVGALPRTTLRAPAAPRYDAR